MIRETREPYRPTYDQVMRVSQSLELPLTTFKVIKLAASNNLLELLAKHLYLNFSSTFDYTILEPINTSCVKTVAALTVIFSEEEKATKIFNLLESSFPLLENIRKIFGYNIYLLLDGYFIRTINRHPQFYSLSMSEQKKALNASLAILLKKYLSYIQGRKAQLIEADGEVKEDHNYEIFSSSTFSFNRDLLEELRETLYDNSFKVKSTTSFVYYVGINYPKLPVFTFVHMFALEQFINDNDKTCYRIYQSWVNEFTLLEDLEIRNYDEEAKIVIDEKEILAFLSDLTNFCCETDSRKVNNFKFFGVEIPSNVPLTIFDGTTLSGLGVRWWVEPFNPNESSKNLRDFCDNHFSFFSMT